jgi:hypothetical protein
MKDESLDLIRIVSIICTIWIILTRIVVIFLIDLLKGEAIPYYNIILGSLTIDLFQILILYCWVNIISVVLTVAILHFPFKPGRFKKYFWLILGVFLLIQPIFLTIVGVLLLIYSKDLPIEKKEPAKKSGGV